MPVKPPEALKPSQLRRTFDAKKLPFETSDQAQANPEAVVGQARAKEALDFGLAMAAPGYHVFVDGPQRTGKTHLVRSLVERIAQEQAPPPDWVYVHNFRQPDQPRALRLPTGGGRVFAKEMENLVEALSRKIPETFEGDEYAKRKEGLQGQFKRQRTEIFSELDRQTREQGYVLKFEPTGIMVAPADEDGQPMPESHIRELDEEAREELRKKSDLIQGKVTESLRAIAVHEKELNQRLAELDREMVLGAVGHLFDELVDKYAELKEVLVYLDEVRTHVGEHFGQFQKKEAPANLPFAMPAKEDEMGKYRVNVFVDNSEATGAPVVVESNPTFPNLFGRIERQAQFGALVTDFTLLKPGALHQANGGYLVIPVLELLKMWLPWDGLKRALRERQAFLEDAMEQLGYMVTRTLKPEPIPLDVKVVLVGPSFLYQLLQAYDPQFAKLFKVRAQMAGRMDWASQEVEDFVGHLCQVAEERKLAPMHRKAAARLVELAAELAEDRERLTLQMSEVEDVLTEGAHYAKKAGHLVVEAEDVETAITQRRRRKSMTEERLREAVTRGFINIETQGEEVGQINGLAVLNTGDYAFGIPSRITASLGLGKAGVVAIDRESKLSGPFHTKGVLILTGFIRNRFGQNGPITLSAGLAFEQSYSHIDGDSASLAETLALLSRISGLPLRQDLAVTGSVSQQGEVQAIGGVNAKVEGFFRLCSERGLTSDQGVVIPASNQQNLMLHPDIVAAAKKKKFAVYPASTVEEAVELFFGKPAGRLKKDGQYTQRSVFAKVQEELDRMREMAKGNNNGNDKKGSKKAKKPSSKGKGKGKK